MILPNKYLTIENSIMGGGALILSNLEKPRTITSLWEEVRSSPQIEIYSRFILILDFLYTIHAITLDNGFIGRANND
jgi:hypothetical protein